MAPPPNRCAKSLVEGVQVVAREVEQAADLADAELDEAVRPEAADQRGDMGAFILFRGVCGASLRKLSTGPGSPFYYRRG